MIRYDRRLLNTGKYKRIQYFPVIQVWQVYFLLPRINFYWKILILKALISINVIYCIYAHMRFVYGKTSVMV